MKNSYASGFLRISRASDSSKSDELAVKCWDLEDLHIFSNDIQLFIWKY